MKYWYDRWLYAWVLEQDGRVTFLFDPEANERTVFDYINRNSQPVQHPESG